jgi:uncharacterized UBP type Zn finger protein
VEDSVSMCAGDDHEVLSKNADSDHYEPLLYIVNVLSKKEMAMDFFYFVQPNSITQPCLQQNFN